MNKFGDKIGQCESCEKENVQVQYSAWFNGFLCESCWDYIADIIIAGD